MGYHFIHSFNHISIHNMLDIVLDMEVIMLSKTDTITLPAGLILYRGVGGVGLQL